MRIHPADSRYFLIDPADLESAPVPIAIQSSLVQLKAIISWAEEFLSKPHPQLGREGSVCPFVKTSMKKGLFWLTLQRGQRPGYEELRGTIMKYRDWFLELEPLRRNEAQYKTILIVFPDIDHEHVAEIIEATQVKLKPEFISQGLMIGEFFAGCPKPGQWNPAFRPLRSPVPLLAIRHMVSSDFLFLQDKRACVLAYLHFFGHAIPERFQEKVQETLLFFDIV